MSKKFLVDILAKAGLVVEGTTDLQGTATAITQSNSDNSTKLATTAFVKNQGYAADSLMVHLAGAETITGVKTFSPTVTASAGLGRSVFIDGTITASANNNTLVGLDIAPVFDASTFTGVNSYAVRISGTYANAYPSYIKFVNNGVGAQTGAAIEFPFGQRIVASSLSPLVGGVGFTFFDKVSNTDGVGLNSSLLQFSSSTPSIKGSGNNGTLTIAQENGTSSFILLKSGGSIGFQTYISAAYTDVVRIFRLTGNVLLQNGGTFTDAGYRLDVNGTVRLQGETRLTTLAGTGDRMVVANSSGVLSTQAIPSVTGFVPYTGATTNVDLGANNLTAAGLTASSLSISVATSTVPVTITNVNGSSGGTLVLNNTSTFGNGLTINKTGAGFGLEVNGYSKFSQGFDSRGEVRIVDNRLWMYAASGPSSDVYARIEFAGAYMDYRPSTIVMNDKQSTYSKTLTLKQSILTTNHNIIFPDASGTVALVSDIPSLTGYVPTSRTITINGTTYDLSANRTWTIAAGLTSFNTRTGDITLASGDVTGALGFTPANASQYVPYTGATANLNLGTFGITTGGITSGGILVSQSGAVSASTGFTAINGTNFGLIISTTSGFNTLIYPSSGSRTYTFPSSGGTIALTSDIPTVAGVYLPLAGGTLTGALNINTSGSTGLNVASDGVIFRSNTGVGSPRQVEISMGGGTSTYLDAKGYGASYNTDFGIRTYNSSGTGFNVFYGTSAGLVGIGTTAPLSKLHVIGTGTVVRFGEESGTTGKQLLFGINSSNGTSEIQSVWQGLANTTLALNPAGGYVGIGTSSPYSTLHVNQGNTNATLVTVGNNNGGSLFGVNASGEGLISTYANGDLIFGRNYASSFAETMRIKSSGLVGIGTTAPESTLVVQKNTTGGRGGELSIVNYATSTTGNEAALNFGLEMSTYGSDNGNAQIKAIISNGANSAADMVFSNWSGASFLERLRITAGGNVGIGTNSPTPHSGSNALVIKGPSGVRGIMELWDGTAGKAVFQQVGGDTYIGNLDKASTGGNLHLLVNGNGSNADIAMKITSGGSVLIGRTTLPYTNYKFITNVGSDLNIGFGTQEGEPSIESFNDAINVPKPLRLYGSKFLMLGGNVGIGQAPLQALGTTLTVNGTIVSQTGVGGGFYNENIRANRTGNGYSAIAMGGANGTVSGSGTGVWTIVATPSTLGYRFDFDYAGATVVAFATNGSITNSTGVYGTISDIKFKENIVDATPKLDDILKLKVRNFNLIGNETKQIGFIAQELEQVFPNMIDVNIEKGSGEEYKSIKTSVLVPMLVKAIQEQQIQIESQATRIAYLENR